MERVDIKSKAKEILEGRRGHYALFLLIAMVCYGILSFILTLIPIIGAIASMAIAIIYQLIMATFTINFCNSREKVDYESIIPTATPIWKYGAIYLLFSLIFVVALIPAGVIITLAFDTGSVISVIVTAVVVALAIFLLSLPFIFTPYIVIENQEESIGKIISESFSMVFSNLGKVIIMYLSLIPWYLLVFITLGLGNFYVIPYVNTIFYVMYKDIRGEQLLELKTLC